MISTEKFYEAFARAGFLCTVTWSPSAGGAAVAAAVRFRAPSRDVLGGDQFSVEYTIRYPAGRLPGLKRGEVVSVAGTDAGRADGHYKVLQDPESRLDGSELEGKLAKLS